MTFPFETYSSPIGNPGIHYDSQSTRVTVNGLRGKGEQGPRDNTYEVEVEATDRGGLPGTLGVSVNLADMYEKRAVSGPRTVSVNIERVRDLIAARYGRIARGGGSGWWLVGRAGSLVGVAVLVAALWGSPSWAQVDVPAAPAGLSYTATHESVTLTWDDPGDPSITGYQILRRPRTGGATLVVHADDTGSAATVYVDSNVVAGGEYVYRIKARNGAGLSEQSPPLEVDVPDPPAEPESAVVGGSVLTLTYGTDLDERSVPAASAFSVTVGGSARDVESVEVDGDRVRLRLVSVVQAGSTVVLDYTAPAVNPLRESGGGPNVADLDDRSVDYTTHIYRELAEHEEYRLGGVWSDGDTMWVGKIERSAGNRKNYVRAYDLGTGLRDSAKDLRITEGVDVGSQIRGLWSDGDYMWVLITDEGGGQIPAYTRIA